MITVLQIYKYSYICIGGTQGSLHDVAISLSRVGLEYWEKQKWKITDKKT